MGVPSGELLEGELHTRRNMSVVRGAQQQDRRHELPQPARRHTRRPQGRCACTLVRRVLFAADFVRGFGAFDTFAFAI